MGKVISRICDCLCVCLQWLELSAPNLVQIYSVATPRHALTLKSKGQGHTVIKTVSYNYWLVPTVAVCCGMPAWDCMLYDCLGF